jgi:uncharacterized protein (TIGR02145 family)
MRNNHSSHPENPKIGVIGVQTILAAAFIDCEQTIQALLSLVLGLANRKGWRCEMKKVTIILALLCAAAFAQQKGTFTDPRDGKTYKTVKLPDGKTWTAENLSYTPSSGTSWCWKSDAAMCQQYGRLYDWDAAMAACPAGWHLPTREEWKALVDAVGGMAVAGGKLKATSGWDPKGSKNGNGTDDYGFSALPGGGGSQKPGSSSMDKYPRVAGAWWTSTENPEVNAFSEKKEQASAQYMDHQNPYVDASNYAVKRYGYSVRCVQGAAPTGASSSSGGTPAAPTTKEAVAAARKTLSSGKEDAGNPVSIATSAGNPYRVTMNIKYNVPNSMDGGKNYLSPAPGHSGVTTVMNDDGSVSVGVVAKDAREFYVYEYSKELAHKKTMKFGYELTKFGAFAKDKEGNYYLFTGKDVAEDAHKEVNMALVKYNAKGEKVAGFYLPALMSQSEYGLFGGEVKEPLTSGVGCRLEISGDMIAVIFARVYFVTKDGTNHQGSFGFVVDKNSLDQHNTTEKRMLAKPFPADHFFGGFILPIENGFGYASQGDKHPRGFMFDKMRKGSSETALYAMTFKGIGGRNHTFAQMGGLAKTPTGYIFAGTTEKNLVTTDIHNDSRNLFILTYDDNLNAKPMTTAGVKRLNTGTVRPVWITDYNDKATLNAGSPKIVEISGGRYLLLWELMTKDKYETTYMTTVDKDGKLLTPISKMGNVRLNFNDPLRYSKATGNVYWAVNDGKAAKVDVYTFNPDKPVTTSDGTAAAPANTTTAPTNTAAAPVGTVTASPKLNGSGTEQSPYQISTAGDLALLGELVKKGDANYNGKHYLLTADINLNAGLSPIGTAAKPFSGVFNGNGKKISGLKVSSTAAGAGLFGCNAGTVKNLGLENVDINSTNTNVGGIAGENQGTITNSYVRGGKVQSTRGDGTDVVNQVGGIAGMNKGAITGCYTAELEVRGAGTRIGGIAGFQAESGTVSNCWSTATVAALKSAGGIVGTASGGISRCAALNAAVSRTQGAATAFSRIVATTTGVYSLSGNTAFAGMTVNGSPIANGTESDKNGLGKTAADLQTASGFPPSLTQSPWSYAPGKLPGFGKPVEMPAHLRR